MHAARIATKGAAVVVNDATTMVPEVAPAAIGSVSDLNEKSSSKKKAKGKKPSLPSSRLESGDKLGNPNRFE